MLLIWVHIKIQIMDMINIDSIFRRNSRSASQVKPRSAIRPSSFGNPVTARWFIRGFILEALFRLFVEPKWHLVVLLKFREFEPSAS